eukprot:g17089.t1
MPLPGHLGGPGARQRRENSDASVSSGSHAGSHATRWSSRRQSGTRRSIGNLFPLTGAGTAKHMLHVANQISAKVNQLPLGPKGPCLFGAGYTSRAERERAEAEEQERRLQDDNGSATGDIAALIEAVEEAEEKEPGKVASGCKWFGWGKHSSELASDDSSGTSGTPSDEEEEGPVEYDSELEDYDHEAAGERIASMLEGLKCQERTEIMGTLSGFYQSKMEGIREKEEELEELEKEYKAREEETKDSLSSMVKAFESKGMTEVQVLVKCSATLQAGANGTLRQRQKFSKAAKKKAALQQEKSTRELKVQVSELPEEENEEAKENAAKKKRLKALFADEVKEEEPVAEEPVEELPSVHVSEEAGSDSDDESARSAGARFGRVSVASWEERGRAQLAKKATETLNATIEFLAQKVAAGEIIDFEHPEVEDAWVWAHGIKELDEEVQDLERILMEQERDIDALYKQREEKAAEKAQQSNRALGEALGEDGEGGALPASPSSATPSPKAKKSVFMDGRLEGIKIQGGEDHAPSMAERMKQAARTAAALSSLKKPGPNQSGAPKLHSPEEFKDDPKVKMLREHIATKDAQLEQGQKLLKRMRFERQLLRYCQRKAKAGFDEIVREFDPPSLETFVDDGAGDEDSAEEETKESKEERMPLTPPPMKPPSKAKSKPEGAAIPSAAQKIMERNAERGEGREAEIELRREVDRLQDELTKQANDLKEEKSAEPALGEAFEGRMEDAPMLEQNKQKNLRKEIKDLRKEFHSLADKNTPKTVDGLLDQIEREEQKYMELQKEIMALKVKLGHAPPESEEAAAADGAEELGKEVVLELPVLPRRSTEATAQAAAESSPGPEAEDAPPNAAASPGATPASPEGSPAAITLDAPASPASAGGSLPGAASPSAASPSSRDGAGSPAWQTPEGGGSPLRGLGREEAAESPAEVRSAGATGDEQEVHPVAPAPISPKSPEQHVAPEVDVESAVGEEGAPGGASAVEAPALTPVDEASVAMAELMQTQAEEMRDEIHDIDLKLKKLKALMKGKGGDADAVVASVRQILGVHHEEEVKAPPAYHQMRKELKEQQDKVRILRKKWWDDHRDFDGLVEKVRNQMGGLHQLFSGPEGKLSLEAAAGGAASQFSDSDQAGHAARRKQPRHTGARLGDEAWPCGR